MFIEKTLWRQWGEHSGNILSLKWCKGKHADILLILIVTNAKANIGAVKLKWVNKETMMGHNENTSNRDAK